MSAFAQPKPGSTRWRHISAVGLVLGGVLACNAVLGIGDAELICAEGGCEDAGVATGNAQPSDSDVDGVPGRDSPGGDGPADAGPQDGALTATPPSTSELPAGSNATPPGGGEPEIDDDNSGSGSDNSGSGSDNSGSGSDGNGGGGTGGPGSGDDDDDEPPPPPSPCQGRASGAVFCSGATRISCGLAESVAQSTTCLSAAHCQEATGPACAACLGTEVRCEGELLVSCNAARTGLDTRRCPSAALCDAATNTCGEAACSAGQSRCRGARLERCNATQTGFDPVTECASPQACNATAGACNVCSPGTARCQENVIAVCDAFGQSEALVSCGLLEACSGGRCVPLGLPL